MRRHTDPDGVVRSVTVATSEWRKLSRQRRSQDRRRCYLWVRCDVEGRKQVPARIVPDGSPEARPAVRR